jgi:hypothetical protein
MAVRYTGQAAIGSSLTARRRLICIIRMSSEIELFLLEFLA